MNQVLETSRLLVREMTLEDLDPVATMLGHPEVMRYWPKTYNRLEATDWIRRQQDRYARDGFGYWLLIDKVLGQPVGQAGVLSLQVDSHVEMGLGYILGRPFWGRGYATEAAIGCRDYAFAARRADRVVALVRPENQPSRNVVSRLGMVWTRNTPFAGFDHMVFEARNSALRPS